MLSSTVEHRIHVNRGVLSSTTFTIKTRRSERNRAWRGAHALDHFRLDVVLGERGTGLRVGQHRFVPGRPQSASGPTRAFPASFVYAMVDGRTGARHQLLDGVAELPSSRACTRLCLARAPFADSGTRTANATIAARVHVSPPVVSPGPRHDNATSRDLKPRANMTSAIASLRRHERAQPDWAASESGQAGASQQATRSPRNPSHSPGRIRPTSPLDCGVRIPRTEVASHHDKTIPTSLLQSIYQLGNPTCALDPSVVVCCRTGNSRRGTS